MTQLDHVDNIASSSAFNSDKIVGIFRDSYLASSATPVGTDVTRYRHDIPHSFGRPVFCELSWSSDGINYYDGGTDNGSQAAIAYSDTTNIHVLTLGNSGTIYYKIIATWIDNFDATNPSIAPVLNTTSNLYFDSRQAIPKVVGAGTTTISGSGSSGIIHGLTFSPRFKCYFESFANQVWPLIAGGVSDIWLYDFTNQAECSALIDSMEITLDYVGPVSSRKLWYRMYK